jgi:heme/copper-type cytochrome/quinol oxidase subunit 2
MALTVFVITAALCLALAFIVWRYWENLTRVSPEDQEREQHIAQLNEQQANRLSDEQIQAMLSGDDEAWQTMVRRGKRKR